MPQEGPKSTVSERIISAIGTLVFTVCCGVYAADGGRGWIVGALAGQWLVVLVVAGLAER